MKHTRSSAEWEIRDSLVTHLRTELPSARIVHELNVDGGQNRADVAAILPEKLLLFEIKSERDTLSLLDRQLKAFSACSHRAFLVAHIRWFDQTPYNNGLDRLAWTHNDCGSTDVWCYPEQPKGGSYRWRIPNDIQASIKQPHARRLLGLLWREELLIEAHNHNAHVHSKLNMSAIVSAMTYYMTGQQIAKAVCRQLRARQFKEADAPIPLVA